MRNEIIRAINDLFDENIDLKVKNTLLEEKVNNNNYCCGTIGKTELDFKIIEYGTEKLSNILLRTYSNGVRVRRDENTKELVITDYETWYKNKIYLDEIPKNMSYDEVKVIIEPYAKECYELEKAESIKNFEESETRDNE